MTRLRRPLAAALVAVGLLAVPGARPAAAVPGPSLPYSWIRQWGGGEVSVQGLAARPGGGVVVAGTGRWYKGYVRAYDAAGSLQWNFTWDVPTDPSADSNNFLAGEKVQDVAVDPEGNVLVVGRTEDPMPGITSLPLQSQAGFIMKLSSTGSRIWTRAIASAPGVQSGLDSIAVERGGDLLVTGITEGPLATLNADPRPAGDYGSFVARYDRDGFVIWSRWTSGDGVNDWTVTADAGGRIFAAGGTRKLADGLPATFNVTAATLGYDGAGTPLYKGVMREPADSGYSTITDVAVDIAGRLTVVGDAAGRMQGAAVGSNGGFVISYDPDLDRRPGTIQGTNNRVYQSVAVSGRGERTVLGHADAGTPGADAGSGLGNGDLTRLYLPAPGQSASSSSRLIGTTFDEYPTGMNNAYALGAGGRYFDAASGRGPYQGTDSTVNFNGFLGASATGNPAPWYPYASASAMLQDLSMRFRGVPMAADFVQSYSDALVANPNFTVGSVIWNFRNETDNTTKVDPVARLFRAYFLRSPDLGGFDHWVKKLRAGTALSTVSANFASSSEFKTRYGTLTNRQFVEKVYQNVLYRNGDAGGITYWTNKLDKKTISRGAVMTNFSESSEGIRLNRGLVDADVTYLQLFDRPPTPTEAFDWDAYRDNTPDRLLYGLAYQDGVQNS